MSGNEIKGVLNAKLNMTQIFNEENRAVPVIVVEAKPCVVTQVRTKEIDGHDVIQIAYGEVDLCKVNKPEANHFKKTGVTPRRHSIEIRTLDVSSYGVGRSVGVDVFGEIGYTDVTDASEGHSFAGGMKRHGFVGQSAAHGNQAAHRRVGGIGTCTTPGHVFRGRHIADHMGDGRVTTQNLKIQKVDADANLLLIKGTVPGVRGDLLVAKTVTKGDAHA